MPAKRRRIFGLNGTADPLIPYTGGISGIGNFMPAQESIYRFAQAMGETGPQLAGGDHGLRVPLSTVYAEEARGIVAAFLLQ